MLLVTRLCLGPRKSTEENGGAEETEERTKIMIKCMASTWFQSSLRSSFAFFAPLRETLFSSFLVLTLVTPTQAAPINLPNGISLKEINFERHVASLLGRMGCNAGSCHGSFQGKGGFYLSLFGYSPDKDYFGIARDGMGRRVNLENPDLSLILLKPTAQVAHEGGKRFAKNSWQYQVFREWIAQGAKNSPGSGAVKKMVVQPGEHRFTKPGETVPLKVVVEFADGTREDMTPFCDFRVKNDFIAEVSSTGVFTGLRPGDTAGVRAQLHRSRGLRQAPAAEYGTVRSVRRCRVPATGHDRYDRLLAYAGRCPVFPGRPGS